MVTSVDGKVTGDFLFRPECEAATEIYYEINRNLKSDGFICGRVTMEGSFTGGYYPDLSDFEAVSRKDGKKSDFIAGEMSGFYAVAFDTYGRLGWKSNRIADPDGDPGYDNAQIIEVLSEQADDRYLGYLRKLGISYIFAGKNEIDVPLALSKLKKFFGCNTLLLEGGSVINGAFQRAGVIDELSLVVSPLIAEKSGKPLFADSVPESFGLISSETRNGTVILKYRKAE